MRPRVILYNPAAVFFTMPLALIAVASALDRRRYDVRIVDGRFEIDGAKAVLAQMRDAHVLFVGMSVLTGAPIRDALEVARAIKNVHPSVPVVWGGWHPSLFPDQTLQDPAIDIVVTGQGELTLVDIAERLESRSPLTGVPGCVVRDGDVGSIRRNAARTLADVNTLPPHDYSLVDVAAFFSRKGRRQLDYVSSQGCRFRCTFCADPFVYNRGWFGLAPDRVTTELDDLWRRYRFDEVAFQDETFFTSPQRVAAIAEGLIDRGMRVTWTATMRADQGTRLDDEVLRLCKRSGLRRAIVGLEAGSQQMLDWMKKDIKVEQAFSTADKCRRLGIGILFNLIVGFPGESEDSIAATLEAARHLGAMSPSFEIAIFYYKPYPGNEIADALVRSGYQFPTTLEEWATFDYVGKSGPWVSPETYRRVERFRFYQRVGWSSRATPLRAGVRALARWRCRRDFYRFAVEKTVAEWLRPPVRLS
jgi:anaerobic magnesium-protoporphyrin IX monomethyl ester cyclase